MDINATSLIEKYLTGESTSEERASLMESLERDEESRRLYLELKNLHDTTNPAFDPASIDMSRAKAKVMSRIFGYRHGFIHTFRRIAAVLFLPLLLGTGYMLSVYLRERPQEVWNTVGCPYGTQSRVVLPDGSLIWINAGSTLDYATGTPPGQDMVVRLTGEAYFEVNASARRRFIVETKNMAVVATGTAFNVSAYDSDSLASVILVRGHVAVRMNNGDTMQVQPNEKLDLNIRNNTVNVFQTNAYKWYAWKDNILVFRNDPLSSVFKRLEQIYNLEFVYNPADIDKHLYRATFQRESCDEIIKLLEMSAPLDFEESRTQVEDVFQKRKIVVTARK